MRGGEGVVLFSKVLCVFRGMWAEFTAILPNQFKKINSVDKQQRFR